MRFKVERASAPYKAEEPPCPEAIKGELGGDPLYHCQLWYVDLGTLEDLMAFVGRYGDCIIGLDWLTIYDDWLE